MNDLPITYVLDEELKATLAALAAGRLPELAEKLKEEAARRWTNGKPPGGLAFSEEAQRVKMERAQAKRERRALARKLKELV